MIDVANNTKALLCMVVNDGKVLRNTFSECNMNDEKLKNILTEENVSINDVFFMLADKNGNYTIVKKEPDE